MEEYKYRTQLYLDDERYQFLKERAARYRISMAEVVRNLIDKELEVERMISDGDPIFRIGAESIGTGRRDGSVNHDAYIYAHPNGDDQRED